MKTPGDRFPLPIDGSQVAAAIATELASQPECFPFEVTDIRKDGQWLLIGLRKLGRGAVPLDDSFEGARAWWPSPEPGTAEVIAVDVENDEVALADVGGPKPEAKGKIFLYPPRFLESLEMAWKTPWRAHQVNNWLLPRLECRTPQPFRCSVEGFPWLRSGQAAAASLPEWPISFLWGPPGTGKTTTLGAVTAALLMQNPRLRILLVSTTNSAADLALVAADKALEELAKGQLTPERQACKRIGTQFLASHYETRKHLLPQRNRDLIRELMEHHRKRPDQGKLAAMADWKKKDEELRQRIREESVSILRNSRLAAMTTTRAAFDLEVLSSLPPFDFLVVDEASQVSLAHALPLLPLAQRVLFAGDPCQLSPICQSDEKAARNWLAVSPFVLEKEIPPGATCFLTEQSRMAEPVCAVVSQAFYDGRLRVCPRAAGDPGWLQARQISSANHDGVSVVPVVAEGYFTQAWEGFVRHESAEKIGALVSEMIGNGVGAEHIQVLTPFRAQRKLIRRNLNAAGCLVSVTTVHRAQGSERKVIIFDPVQGNGSFLNCEEGFRLINVAFSRAQALLVVLLSSGDAQNPKLAGLAPAGLALPLFCELAAEPAFPDILTTKIFGYQGTVLKGTRFDGQSLKAKIGDERKSFSLRTMIERCGNPAKCPRRFQPPFSRCCTKPTNSP